MATESDVDIRSAHPYWAYPYNDISVVHNGQITNYWIMRREMERKGHRFMSSCDSELLAVYTAHNLSSGASLEDSLKSSIQDIDGVFTYLVATGDALGMAKDTMAAKPMVLYESDNLVALASEEVAIRSVIPQEIDTWDPYDEEVRVWQALKSGGSCPHEAGHAHRTACRAVRSRCSFTSTRRAENLVYPWASTSTSTSAPKSTPTNMTPTQVNQAHPRVDGRGSRHDRYQESRAPSTRHRRSAS